MMIKKVGYKIVSVLNHDKIAEKKDNDGRYL